MSEHERPEVYLPACDIITGDKIVIENMIYTVDRIDPKGKHWDGITPATLPVFHLSLHNDNVKKEITYSVACIDTPIRVWEAIRAKA